MKKLIMCGIFAIFSVCFTDGAVAETTSSGVIKFKGYIYEDPCQFDMNFKINRMQSKCYSKKETSNGDWKINEFNFEKIGMSKVDMGDYLINKEVLDYNAENIIITYK